jgi:hypothetical protein
MGEIKPPANVMLLAAVFSRHEAALDWARERTSRQWGPIMLASEVWPFVETAYYEPTMGCGLQKQLLAFEPVIDPARLVECKHQAVRWEAEYALTAGLAETRPLNIDPGYLTLAKLVLASTKDHAHRIYLDRGIFAEVTLSYRQRQWRHHQWTFPDYRRPEYHDFFDRCRQWLKQQAG